MANNFNDRSINRVERDLEAWNRMEQKARQWYGDKYINSKAHMKVRKAVIGEIVDRYKGKPITAQESAAMRMAQAYKRINNPFLRLIVNSGKFVGNVIIMPLKVLRDVGYLAVDVLNAVLPTRPAMSVPGSNTGQNYASQPGQNLNSGSYQNQRSSSQNNRQGQKNGQQYDNGNRNSARKDTNNVSRSKKNGSVEPPVPVQRINNVSKAPRVVASPYKGESLKPH